MDKKTMPLTRKLIGIKYFKSHLKKLIEKKGEFGKFLSRQSFHKSVKIPMQVKAFMKMSLRVF